MYDWVDDVAASGTFVKSGAATWTNTYGTSAIPSGWSVVVSDVAPATGLCFRFATSGSFAWRHTSDNYPKTIYYKKNSGSWIAIASTSSGTVCSCSSGDVIQVYGKNTSYNKGDYSFLLGMYMYMES